MYVVNGKTYKKLSDIPTGKPILAYAWPIETPCGAHEYNRKDYGKYGTKSIIELNRERGITNAGKTI